MKKVYIFMIHDRSDNDDIFSRWEKENHMKIICHNAEFLLDARCVHSAFSKTRPDVIVTIGVPKASSVVLRQLPRYMRRRWIHVDTFENLTPEIIDCCYEKALEWNLKPCVTVFTTAFQSDHRILRPFSSLQKQTCREWEWIILDDSPYDAPPNNTTTTSSNLSATTWERLKDLASLDCRIRLYKPLHHRGDIGAVKRDVAMMGYGRYLLELDHDDELAENAIETIVHVMDSADPDVGMASSDFIEMYEDTRETHVYGSHFALNFGSYYKQLWGGVWVNVCRTPPINAYTIRHIVGVPNHVRVWRASVYRKLGGHDPNLNVADDYELIIRTFLEFKMIRIPMLLYVQYRNSGANNFTFHRNGLIQYLVRRIANRYDEKIHQRILDLGQPDDVYSEVQNLLGSTRVQAYDDNVYLKPGITPRPLDILWDPYEDQCVSVVMGVTDRMDERQIELLVQSVLEQTFHHIVMYVIGNGHKDMDIIMNKIHDSRVRYWNLSHETTKPTENLVVCRNYALRMLVSTKWVTYAGEQPWDNPKHIATMIASARKTDPDIVLFSNDGSPKNKRPTQDSIRAHHLLHKRSLLEAYGYFQNSSTDPAWDLIDRWLRNDATWIIV